MSNILSSGNENNADKTFSFSADLSWSSYPYKIWTKNGEDQTVYYGDWIEKPSVATCSRNARLRPVIFKVERTDEEAAINYNPHHD